MIYSDERLDLLNGIKIDVVSNENGDWEELFVDGQLVYEGHQIPTHVFLEFLNELGADISEIELEVCKSCFEPTHSTFDGMCEDCYEEEQRQREEGNWDDEDE